MMRTRLRSARLSSVISISMVLLLVGIASILLLNATRVSDYFKENMQISVLMETEASDEMMVYVTPAGEVYHRDRSCTYLKPSIRTVFVTELDTIRSRDGSKYYPCERCRPEGCSMVVIARDGNRYHASSGCSAIQRDVDALALSEAEKTRRACSKCGGS